MSYSYHPRSRVRLSLNWRIKLMNWLVDEDGWEYVLLAFSFIVASWALWVM